MALVLSGNAVIRCSHQGTVRATPSQQGLKVDGTAVLVESDLTSATISGCTNTDARAGQVPCASITSIVAGVATKLKVGGKAVVLEGASGITSSTPPGTFSVSSAGQSKLRAS